MKTCKKCSENVKLHLTCFKCSSIYHPTCLSKTPSVYVNEKGHIFCCQNLISNCNSFESKSQTQENKNGRCKEEGACDLENSKLEQEKYEKSDICDEHSKEKEILKEVDSKLELDKYDICDEHSKKKEILENVDRDRGFEKSKLEQYEYDKDDIHDTHFMKKEALEQVDRDEVRYLVDFFICSFCEDKVKFYEEESYREHMKLCEKNHLRLNKTQDTDNKFEKMYKCDKCSYMSKFRYAVKTHSSVHSLEKQFKCPFKSCKCSQSLDTSVKECDCSSCEYRTASKKYLQRHILQNHSNRGKKYTCNYCTYSTPIKGRLPQHKCTRPSEKSFKCNICTFESVYNASLVKHKLLKHSNVEKKYKCNNCESSFHEKRPLIMHLRTHSNGKHLRLNKTQDTDNKFEKMYKCDKCSYMSKFRYALKTHSSVHSLEKQFKCPFKSCKCSQSLDTSVKQCDCSSCEYRTASKKYLQRHILQNHSNRGKKYTCNYCTYSTPIKGRLPQHKCTRPSEKSFKCNICTFESVYNASLVKHMLLKHSNVEKKYKCNNCESSFHEKRPLIMHLRTHSNGKLFKCGKCDYATALKCQLTIHKAKHNFGSKYHMCGTCGFATAFKSNLTRHINQQKCKDGKYFIDMEDDLKKDVGIHINKSL